MIGGMRLYARMWTILLVVLTGMVKYSLTLPRNDLSLDLESWTVQIAGDKAE